MQTLLKQAALKRTLVELLEKSVERELETALKAASQARSGSTHSDAEAKSKYETQATELSYLANGQTMRAKELHHQLSIIRQYQSPSFKPEDAVAVGSIIHVLTKTKQTKQYFILPFNAGVSFSVEDRNYQILAATAPLATHMLGLFVGDEIDGMEDNIILVF